MAKKKAPLNAEPIDQKLPLDTPPDSEPVESALDPEDVTLFPEDDDPESLVGEEVTTDE